MERKHLIHTIAPVFNQDSKVLLLGTFPSPKSREVGFYYSHPRNRFWTIIADLCSCDIPITKDEKIQFLLTHKIALWDMKSIVFPKRVFRQLHFRLPVLPIVA